MKRKTNLILLAALVIILATVYLLTNNPFSTIRPELKDFAIKDVSKVTKVFMNRKDESITLEKQASGEWLVNGKTPAWQPRIDMLLNETMAKIDVKSPVPDAIYNRVVNQLANHSVKAVFYEGDKVIKAIYVGDNTADELGTYMYIEGSDKPFVVHIPGFNGYVNSRFSLDEKEWQTRSVIALRPEKLRELRVEYPAESMQSIMFIRDQNDSFKLLSPSIPPDNNISYNVIMSYLNLFRDLNMEGFPLRFDSQMGDSILRTPPLCRILLFYKDETIKEVLIYRKLNGQENVIYDKNGRQLTHDPERYYAFIDKNRTPVIIQDYVFGKVMLKASDFKK